MPDDAIVLDHARIVRGGSLIIPDLSMHVRGGGIVGLVGPSGSGKTTVMRAILGLTRLAGGSAMVLGSRAGSAVLRPRIGYMPQGEGVYPDLTGRQNLEFFAGVYRVGESRVDTLLDLMDLGPVVNRRVDTYSGGQRNRVGLAIALLHNPELLILDEPTVGLDPRLRQQLWSLFRESADAGATLMISTHVMDEASHCDRVAFLLDGRLVAFDTPQGLMAQTRTSDMDAAALVLSDREAQDVD